MTDSCGMETGLICACGCGQSFAPSGKSGQVRAYFSRSCRQRAYVRRRVFPLELPVLNHFPALLSVEVPSAVGVAKQIERGLLEVRSLGITFENLGRVAQPDLAWRCSVLGSGILSSLVASFGQGVE